jgi:hypothetical protein
MAVRNQKGQFEKGSSGNEYGRPAKEKTSHRLPARNRNAILDIAERRIDITIGGKKEELTLFEANVLRLGMDGAQGNRVSARQFAKLVEDTAKEDLTMKLSVKRADGGDGTNAGRECGAAGQKRPSEWRGRNACRPLADVVA